ncbi:hypothetical protein [Lacticaseibacillus kribbianus]|uniref:hypothetical protein n=1 Tax=Lacticaseibacillus kribbianus TaxID=2926292 RepID=UPI001CD4098C|nr:hypothetical protein [Lacticaseibacillus kribbianus]
MTTIIALSDLHGELATLERLAAQPDRVVVLKGNHEQGLLDFVADSSRRDWLDYGGLETLREATRAWSPDRGPLSARAVLIAHEGPLLAWLAGLPTTFARDHLLVVHAGLDLALADPVAATTRHDRLWLDARYWYAPGAWGVFGHNPLPYTIVSGHTPTARISGRYRHDEGPVKRPTARNPIFGIRYPAEYPRYFIDGGVGSGLAGVRLGNIAVLDSASGLLIDAYED